MLKGFCVRGLVTGNVLFSAFKSLSTRSSQGVRVLPREGQAGGEKEGPFGLHKVGTGSGQLGQRGKKGQ